MTIRSIWYGIPSLGVPRTDETEYRLDRPQGDGYGDEMWDGKSP